MQVHTKRPSPQVEDRQQREPGMPRFPFPVENDPQRRDTAPHSAPIRNKRRGKFFGPIPDKPQFFAGVMDREA